MAALTLPEALKRSRNLMFKSIAKEIVTTDELGAVMPIVPTDGTEVPVMREGTLPDTEFIGDDGAATEESTGTDDLVKVPMRRIVGNLDVDAFADDLTGSGPGSQRGAQVAKKAKATWRKIKDKLVNGAHVTGHTLGSSADPFAALASFVYGPYLDSSRRGPGSLKYTHAGQLWQFRAPGDVDYGTAVAATADGTYTLKSWNPSYFITVTITELSATTNGETHIRFTSTAKEFDGMKELCAPARLIDPVGTDGDDFALSMLDRMISNEKVKINRAFIANSALVEKYFAAWRAFGGADPRTISLPGYGAQVPTYRGIPILENDNIANDETVGATTDATSIYLASLDADEGLALYAAGGSQLPADGDPRARIVLGFRVVDLGERDEADHRRIRVKWYGAPGLKSTLALVRRRGVKSA